MPDSKTSFIEAALEPLVQQNSIMKINT